LIEGLKENANSQGAGEEGEPLPPRRVKSSYCAGVLPSSDAHAVGRPSVLFQSVCHAGFGLRRSGAIGGWESWRTSQRCRQCVDGLHLIQRFRPCSV